MQAKLLLDLDVQAKILVIREDLNVPVKNSVITNDKRIRSALPTIEYALKNGAGVVLLSHLGRPEEGVYDPAFSLEPVAKRLSELLNAPVTFARNLDEVQAKIGTVCLLDNIRFFKGEKKNSPELAAKLADLGDIYVMDAFGAAHRAHASTEGAVRAAKLACAGPLMAAEMIAAEKLLQAPIRPLHAIVGGSKVSTKLSVLENLCNKVDVLITGGGIANTFLLASGKKIGKSLAEPELLSEAIAIMQKCKERKLEFPLPLDVCVAKKFAENQPTIYKDVDDLADDDMILDIGPKTVALYRSVLAKAGTIVWNGPVGAFEIKPFDYGTYELAQVVAASSAYSLVCGGDSIAAVEQFKLADKIDYISTGGGAFLEVLEGKILPSVAALNEVNL